jgi:hypothetical protein
MLRAHLSQGDPVHAALLALVLGTTPAFHAGTLSLDRQMVASLSPVLAASMGATEAEMQARMVHRMQLQQDLHDLQRKQDDNHWITGLIVSHSLGVGLFGLGFGLDIMLNQIVGGSAGQIAGYWTSFGLTLAAGICFAVITTVALVQMVFWIVGNNKLHAKQEEIRAFDAQMQQQGVPANEYLPPPTVVPPPPPPTGMLAPTQPLFTFAF